MDVPADVPADAPAGQWRPKNKSQLVVLKSQTLDPADTIPAPSAIPLRGLIRRTRFAGFQFEEDTGPAPAPPVECDRLLDGFMLLEACRVEFPDEARRADVNGIGVGNVAEEDMQYFTNLSYLDIGDSRAPLEPLGALPGLRELHIQCNLVRSFDMLSGFPMLEILDLSYNMVPTASVSNLTALPNLRELDLTCNTLTALPEDMHAFEKLELLILERNRLQGAETVLALSKMPKLKLLNCAFNYFTAIPVPDPTLEDPWFSHLEEFNLANNYIAREDDIVSLPMMPRLQLVILYGNPLTQFVQQTELLGGAGAERKITTVTTMPDFSKKPSSGAYKTVQMATVREMNIPTAAQFKDRGNRTLLPPQTVLMPQQTAAPARSKVVETDEADGTFLTGVGLADEEEEEDDDDDDDLHVPDVILTRSLAPPERGSDPAKLRGAINSLRYALNHPLTSHSTIPKKGELQVDRPTFLQMCRQRPRKEYQPKNESLFEGSKAENKEALGSIEQVLDEMNERMKAAETDVTSVINADKDMESLVGMVQNVMDTYNKS
jgi:hypothetical protein